MSDPSTQPVAVSAFSRARAALIAWWSDDDDFWKVAWKVARFVIGVSLLSGTALIVSTCAGLTGLDKKPIAEQPAASAPATTAETDLQAQVDALRLRVAALEAYAPQTGPEPEFSQVQHRASATHATTGDLHQIANQRPHTRRWGTTDLDREIDRFTRSINTPEQAK